MNGQAVTTSLIIAENTENKHKNVLELIRTYVVDLERFGRVAFKTRSFKTAGGDQLERANLRENKDFLKLAEKGDLSATGQKC